MSKKHKPLPQYDVAPDLATMMAMQDTIPHLGYDLAVVKSRLEHYIDQDASYEITQLKHIPATEAENVIVEPEHFAFRIDLSGRETKSIVLFSPYIDVEYIDFDNNWFDATIKATDYDTIWLDQEKMSERKKHYHVP